MFVLCVFIRAVGDWDSRSNTLCTVKANWTKNYSQLAIPIAEYNDSSLSADITAALHGRHNGSYWLLIQVGKSSFCGMHTDSPSSSRLV